MANRQQFKLLKSSVEAWNQWRLDNPAAVINLQGANLKGLPLQGINLSKANIRGTNFAQADLTQVNLEQATTGS